MLLQRIHPIQAASVALWNAVTHLQSLSRLMSARKARGCSGIGCTGLGGCRNRLCRDCT